MKGRLKCGPSHRGPCFLAFVSSPAPAWPVRRRAGRSCGSKFKRKTVHHQYGGIVLRNFSSSTCIRFPPAPGDKMARRDGRRPAREST